MSKQRSIPWDDGLSRKVREWFTPLASGTVFFDNPGGTQVPRQVIQRLTAYLEECNANHGGCFATSRRSDEMLDEAHRAAADFLGASPGEVVFGANMTTLTLALARSLTRQLAPGDEIIVTRLDHDANISPWLLAAADSGARVQWVDIHPEDCTLQLEDFDRFLTDKTRLVAVGLASNAMGTVNPVQAIVRKAHSRDALVFVDAVHFAPHGAIDVRELDCDFLACSAYKFFGPHIGLLYGRRELLERLPAYKVRPADDHPPGKFETGTQNHEGIAGFLGVIEYLEWLGASMGVTEGIHDRRLRLHRTMEEVRRFEQRLGEYLIRRLQQVEGVKIWGITGPARSAERVPTVTFTSSAAPPQRIAQSLAEAGVNVWSGHYYAIEVMRRLGLLDRGGMVRVGLVHYNTTEEVDRMISTLEAQ